jgi:hypothetical protein
MPLVLPPGAAGRVPSLGVAYSRAAGDGMLGRGFSLSGFSAIRVSNVPGDVRQGAGLPEHGGGEPGEYVQSVQASRGRRFSGTAGSLDSSVSRPRSLVPIPPGDCHQKWRNTSRSAESKLFVRVKVISAAEIALSARVKVISAAEIALSARVKVISAAEIALSARDTAISAAEAWPSRAAGRSRQQRSARRHAAGRSLLPRSPRRVTRRRFRGIPLTAAKRVRYRFSRVISTIVGRKPSFAKSRCAATFGVALSSTTRGAPLASRCATVASTSAAAAPFPRAASST